MWDPTATTGAGSHWHGDAWLEQHTWGGQKPPSVLPSLSQLSGEDFPPPHLKCLCIPLTADELLAVGDIQQPPGHLQDSPGGIRSLEHEVLVPVRHSPGTQQQPVRHILLVPGVDTAEEEEEDGAATQKLHSYTRTPAQDSPAIGRVLIAQIHGYGHESAGHPGIGNNPQVGCLVPAEPGEAVVRTPTAVGGQLRGTGEMGEWLSSQNWPLQSLPGIFSTWQDAAMCLQHPLPAASLEVVSSVGKGGLSPSGYPHRMVGVLRLTLPHLHKAEGQKWLCLSG